MPERRRTTLIAAAAGALALALTSCAGGNGTAPAADDNLSLSVGIQSPPNSLDPAQLHDGQQRFIWGSIYDTLLYSDNEGELQPSAAESWEYSEDARSLTLNLRDGMTFSDGDPVNAQAVKSTLDRTRETAGPQQNNLSAVEAVEAPDDKTVVLSLNRTDPNLLTALAFGAGVIGDPETLDEDSTALNPIASGPYVLDREATTDGSVYSFTLREDHWNADAYPYDELKVRVIGDRTALFNALLTGEVDAGTADASQAPQAEGAGFTLTDVPGVATAGLVIADRAGEVVPALADVRVRQAINMAFDRDGILEAILRGNGQATEQIFSSVTDAYVPADNAAYAYDVEGAKALMAEAGYPDGFTLTMPAQAQSQPFQPTIGQALTDIGITVEWEPVPAQQSGQTTKWGAYFNIGGTVPPSRTTALYFAPNGSQNPFAYEDPAVTALLDQLGTQTDQDEADETYRQLNTWAVDNAWFAPMFEQTTTWVTKSGVSYVGTGVSGSDIRVFGVDES